jgi:predicted ATPase
VTILVGENGSGKSTLLKSIAVAAESVAVGGDSLERDESLGHARALATYLRLSWTRKTRQGFFLRSEDFFNFARRVREEQAELRSMADEFGEKYKGYGRMLAVGAALGQQQALRSQYGEDLDANSHGESFLRLFQSRLTSGGLYILDEPEAPLSPVRQIALIAMILDSIKKGSQFLIATHSPILMACPEAQILNIEGVSISAKLFEDLEHVKVTKAFLSNPGSFLRHL